MTGDRLTRRADYQAVYSRRRAFANDDLVVYVKRGEAGLRLGVVTGRRIGKSAARNRSRRLVREAFSTLTPLCIGSWDVVVICRRNLKDRTRDQVGAKLAELLRRAGVTADA